MWKIQLFVFVEALLHGCNHYFGGKYISYRPNRGSVLASIVLLHWKTAEQFSFSGIQHPAVFYCHVKSLCHRCAFVCRRLCHAGGLSLFLP